MDPDVIFDFATIGPQIVSTLTAVGLGIAAVVGAGLSWMGIKWGLPQLVGLFKKTAK